MRAGRAGLVAVALALAALLLVPVPAQAAIIVLDFEGIGNLPSGVQVLEFYNGGTDQLGNSGTNYGISFGAASLGIIDSDAGGGGNFANEPSPSTVLFFLTGSAILNVAAGFDTGFSFFYTSPVVTGTVTVSGERAPIQLTTSVSGVTRNTVPSMRPGPATVRSRTRAPTSSANA